MENKKNILEICNWLWIWWTEKTLQIFCKYLDKNKYNVFTCWIFKWWEREELIKEHVLDLLVANWDTEKIKEFTLKNNINIVHWHSITQSPWIEFEKSLELLKFFKDNNIKIIETSPFALYNKEVDDLLNYRFFVSKNTLLKFIQKFKININNNKYDYLYNPIDINLLEFNKITNEERVNIRKKIWIKNDDILVWMIWRDDLWRWDDNFLYLISKLSNDKNIKFIFKKIPEYYKSKIKKRLLSKCIFLDLSSNEVDISNFHQIIDINLHDTRLWETFWLSIAESIFYNKIVLTQYIDYTNKYLFDRNSWQFEFLEYYDNLFFYQTKKDLLNIFNKIINNTNFKSNNQYLNKFDIYNPVIILNKFDYILNNNFINNELNCEFEKYEKLYNYKFKKKEKILVYLYNNFKWLYYYLINKL